MQARKDFPIFEAPQKQQTIYLDSAASAQKPKQVIEAMSRFYSQDYANIHRGIYTLSSRATTLYEKARETVKEFINANTKDEIIFVRGTTEAINLVAQCFGKMQFKPGDEIILSVAEHHANIVPWHLLKTQIGIEIKIIPLLASGELDEIAYQKLFSNKTKLVALTHVSNVLGIVNDVKRLVAFAHENQVPVLLDGAQAVPHLAVDVQAIDCDFYAFSAHKLYGPTGIGVLYGKKKWLTNLPPYQGGGSMIESVSFSEITYATLPHRFEAGTPDIVGAIGLAAAIQYINQMGLENLIQHDQMLLAYTEAALLQIPGLRIIGTASPKIGVVSFVIDGIHPHDIGTVLDDQQIAIRAGHHCAMPLMEQLKLPATVRASLGIYNDKNDIDALVEGLFLAKRLFS
jgi:cysteine desulfurase / selenocysteine lyase